ncbi:hypothetical protein FA95DRAFT_1571647 [Auriscalpium vulgare]|uniref:Uncharacterized protein n=1 Tax=Auriscalpium vulgare TaxID=40419 RepID=A0ACB8RXE0_9AGAM|nr:hypothetical protein FA95DRAFT_1571647 [Auriscalpium vulgare]
MMMEVEGSTPYRTMVSGSPFFGNDRRVKVLSEVDGMLPRAIECFRSQATFIVEKELLILFSSRVMVQYAVRCRAEAVTDRRKNASSGYPGSGTGAIDVTDRSHEWIRNSWAGRGRRGGGGGWPGKRRHVGVINRHDRADIDGFDRKRDSLVVQSGGSGNGNGGIGKWGIGGKRKVGGSEGLGKWDRGTGVGRRTKWVKMKAKVSHDVEKYKWIEYETIRYDDR